MIEISDSQARLVRDIVTELVVRRGSRPVPASVHQLLTALTSADGSSDGGGRAESNQDRSDLIDSQEAATILGCSTRWITHIAADLDGQKPNGRYVFNRNTVTEYAQARRTP